MCFVWVSLYNKMPQNPVQNEGQDSTGILRLGIRPFIRALLFGEWGEGRGERVDQPLDDHRIPSLLLTPPIFMSPFQSPSQGVPTAAARASNGPRDRLATGAMTGEEGDPSGSEIPPEKGPHYFWIFLNHQFSPQTLRNDIINQFAKFPQNCFRLLNIVTQIFSLLLLVKLACNEVGLPPLHLPSRLEPTAPEGGVGDG